MEYDHPNQGFEFDWIASDRNGLVAILSTAGFGPVPKSVIVKHSFIPELMDRIKNGPIRCDGRVVGEPGYCNDWEEYAKRGFYGFDWSHTNNRYEVMSIPRAPISTSEIEDSDITAAAVATQLDISFEEKTPITVDTSLLKNG